MLERLAVVADDLTGASDAAVAFAAVVVERIAGRDQSRLSMRTGSIGSGRGNLKTFE
jgi:uncharacterized protein YgbK (DUF1537 family)